MLFGFVGKLGYRSSMHQEMQSSPGQTASYGVGTFHYSDHHTASGIKLLTVQRDCAYSVPTGLVSVSASVDR